MSLFPSRTLEITSSPHLKAPISTDKIMRNVVWALIPVVLFSFYAFGLAGALVILTALISCVATEHLVSVYKKEPTSIHDWSAVITGLLLGLTLPPAFPLWMTALGGIVAILIGKSLFGGLGYNRFNPALVGRVFLQAAFPVAITTWYPAFTPGRFTSLPSSTFGIPFLQPTWDAVTTATPLGLFKFEGQISDAGQMALGLVAGSTGETSAVLILLGGIYLAWRKMLNWKIPVSILGTIAVLSFVFHLISPETYPSAAFMLVSGGLMLGAVFMATDMVASPMTNLGVWIYGFLIGLIIYVIRVWGGLPEGVMYAILLGNACSPLIDKMIKTRVYGTTARRPAA